MVNCVIIPKSQVFHFTRPSFKVHPESSLLFWARIGNSLARPSPDSVPRGTCTWREIMHFRSIRWDSRLFGKEKLTPRPLPSTLSAALHFLRQSMNTVETGSCRYAVESQHNSVRDYYGAFCILIQQYFRHVSEGSRAVINRKAWKIFATTFFGAERLGTPSGI